MDDCVLQTQQCGYACDLRTGATAQAQARRNHSIERGGRPEVSALVQELLAHDCWGKRESWVFFCFFFKGVNLSGQQSWVARVGKGERSGRNWKKGKYDRNILHQILKELMEKKFLKMSS